MTTPNTQCNCTAVAVMEARLRTLEERLAALELSHDMYGQRLANLDGSLRQIWVLQAVNIVATLLNFLLTFGVLAYLIFHK